MLIGVMIMSVLVVAAGVLLFTTPTADEDDPGPAIAAPPTVSVPGEGGNESVEGVHTPPPPEESPNTPPPPEIPPPPEVRSVSIVYGSQNRVMTDFTVRVGEPVPLRVRVEPAGVGEEIIWFSSNTAVFEVVPTNMEGTAARVTGQGRGTATLTVTVGGITAECTVRGRQ